MAKKSLGYVKLEWTCPACETKNPGPEKTCRGCGAPQPDHVEFHKASQDKFITDEKEIAGAKAGVDIHCPYCGTRNPHGAKICTQCGGDLSEGNKRSSGQVLGAFQEKPVTISCPNCGKENNSHESSCSHCGAPLKGKKQQQKPAMAPQKPAPAKRKISPIFLAIPLFFFLGCLILLVLIFSRKSDVTATVADVSWTRSISIEEFGEVNRKDWMDQIPANATIGQCVMEYHHTSDQPEANSTEVCGTPYVVDDGTGYGEVVEDCVYEVYQEKCDYSVEEWYFVSTITENGNDLSPAWPAVMLSSNQREGVREEEYRVKFNSDGRSYTYMTKNESQFIQFIPGSSWELTVNGLNAITDIKPAN